MKGLLLKGDAERVPLPDRSVDLIFESPPYRKARLYLEDGRDLGIARDTEDWIAWMLRVVAEGVRVCRGPVMIVAAGSTEDRNYHPICEGLMYRWWHQGGSAYRPCYWHRYGIPGSGGDQWFRADIEYVMCFKREGALPWSDNTAMGHPPLYDIGGELSYRTTDGRRINQAKGNKRFGGRANIATGRKQNGQFVRRENSFSVSARNPDSIANPGNLIDTGSGGGNKLGHPLAHENEAPFDEDLARFFIKSLCPPGGVVLDRFSGSGTTASVAEQEGRVGIGLDLRRSQCLIAMQRLERPHAPVPRPHREEHHPLFDDPAPGDSP